MDRVNRDEFLSLAAHEFRTPVTVIKAQAQLSQKFLERGEFSEAIAEQHLKTFVRESDRLARLCSDLLLLARLDSNSLELELSHFGLKESVERTLKKMRAELEPYLIDFFSDEEVFVYADAERTEHVLENLLSNAIRSNPRGTRLEVRVGASEHEALLTVRDEGMGIPHEEIEKIFDRYFQVRQAGLKGPGGLGISLYLCRALVHRMRGRIQATSEGHGRGAQILLALPRGHQE